MISLATYEEKKYIYIQQHNMEEISENVNYMKTL